MQYAFCKRQGSDITDVHTAGCPDIARGLDRGNRMMHSHGKQKAYDDYYVFYKFHLVEFVVLRF